MEIRLLRLFQREVERQCKYAIMAHENLKQALQSHDMERLWYSVQNLLVAVGNISKLLWDKTHPERRAALRTSLNIPDDSPLKPRFFRNKFEHFDDCLEQWATSSERHNFADSNVGPPDMIVGFEPGDYLRNFDTTNFAVTFHGDRYNLRLIIEAIEVLLKKASTECNKPHWVK